MDAIMQTLKQCINLRTLFFELFSKKPLETIDDLFWRGNYYAMLENDPRAVSQQLIVATHPTDSPRGISNKCSNVRIGSREKKEQARTERLSTVSIRHYSFEFRSEESIDKVLTFSPIDLKWVATPHEDALVLELSVSRFQDAEALVRGWIDCKDLLGYLVSHKRT
ncbi:hypothetical protein CK203_008520 [Vitis vinifera]|uniref:Uncharacterized protein n=1 Tax=Vitis vinifera TaxID=29760 RepID=A0A438KD84_VITVI|nr:hypothetical protein CK203_008520 [Vitis vinifera]